MLGVVGIFCGLFVFAVTEGYAQTQVVAPVEHVDFNRPEAWALKYFTSTTLLGGFEVAEGRDPGSFALGLDVVGLPSLNAAERRVGFDGTKEEDLNKAPLFVRPRLSIGLPDRFTLTLAVTPPITVFGLKPWLLAAGLERPMYTSHQWSLGWRTYGQIGTVTGAFTCPRSVLAFPEGSAENSYGCEAESSDVVTLRYAGAELMATRSVEALGKVVPHLAVGGNYVNSIFQVNAHTFGFLDRTRIQTSGATVSFSGGVGYRFSRRAALSADLFYTPLSVQPAFGAAVSTRSLLTARGSLTFRLR
jgi:hypothetical protein